MPTVNLAVAASADDGYERADTTVDITATLLSVTAGEVYSICRFNNVTVSKGAVIDAADFKIYLYTTSHDSPNMDVHCEDADDSAQPVVANTNISARSRTTAKTVDNGADVGVGTRTISIVSAVKEVIDRAGWASGNDLSVIMKYVAGGDMYCRSFDYSGGVNKALLDITYHIAGGYYYQQQQ